MNSSNLFAKQSAKTENSNSTLSGINTNNKTIRLHQPRFNSKISTISPTFTWHPFQQDSLFEYRLLVSQPNGKIVIDEWVGQDTIFIVKDEKIFSDLNAYYWMVYSLISNNRIESPVWSFCIDKDLVSDLRVNEISIVDEKTAWEPGEIIKIKANVQNSGPSSIDQCYLKLYSGNINRNYFDYSSLRKSKLLMILPIHSLPVNQPRNYMLTGQLTSGFNHFFIQIDAEPESKEIFWPDNFQQGLKIQTEKRTLLLNGLFVIYSNYNDPEADQISISENKIDSLSIIMNNFQNYFWDHTHTLQIVSDTVRIDRILSDKDFRYQDDQWGYLLTPKTVQNDLNARFINPNSYDFIYVFYSWHNSPTSWSGYNGYAFGRHGFSDINIHFSAQPIIDNIIGDEKIMIHEFFHLLDYFFERNNHPEFYSPHHRTLYTTFQNDEDYFDWILETWPTAYWFDLKQGLIQPKNNTDTKISNNISNSQPANLVLFQNYPNPFNKLTTISYKIPPLNVSSAGTPVKLCIYDILGNKILTLVDQVQSPGTYQFFWNGRDDNNNQAASGIYFYELKVHNQRRLMKMLYIH